MIDGVNEEIVKVDERMEIDRYYTITCKKDIESMSVFSCLFKNEIKVKVV